MSYCVNCGVELDASARECPLCNTPVINPRQGIPKNVKTPFPKEMGQVETVKSKDAGILLSVVVLATAITCGLLNAFVFQGTLWSVAVIGVCVVAWVIMVPIVIYKGLHIYASLLLDGISVAIYLYMLTYMIDSDTWFWKLGLPIVVYVTLLIEIVTLCIRVLPKSFLTNSLYVITGIALLCTGLEALIDYYVEGYVVLRWSAVVLTICVVIDVTIITLLSRRRLRNAVRRRLHF